MSILCFLFLDHLETQEREKDQGEMAYVLTDKRHYIQASIYAYLIDYPQAGWILVNTCINLYQTKFH